jgi:hypothetical protein
MGNKEETYPTIKLHQYHKRIVMEQAENPAKRVGTFRIGGFYVKDNS